MLTFFYLLHRNLSIAVACKLLHEPNVLFIILLGIFNVIVEIVKPFDHMSVFLACTYLFNGIFFILFDAMERKNRGMIIVVGIVFALITIYNMYSVTFTHIDNNTILFLHGSSRLSNADNQIIRGIAKKALATNSVVHVKGHASMRTRDMDPVEHALANFNISIKRANAVAKALISNGVPAEKLIIDAVGASEPISSEAMPNGERANRRAEISLSAV